MWEINNSLQIVTFLYSCVLGLIFCLFYDILRAIRQTFKITFIVTFFQDIFYFIILAVITFIFLLSLTNGEIRAYVLIGILIGFLVSIFTFSKFFVKILKYIFLKVKVVLCYTSDLFNKLFIKADGFIAKILKNIKNSCKKGLKKVKRMLYTKK